MSCPCSSFNPFLLILILPYPPLAHGAPDTLASSLLHEHMQSHYLLIALALAYPSRNIASL